VKRLGNELTKDIFRQVTSGTGARTPCQQSTPRSTVTSPLTDYIMIFVTNVQSDTREQPTSL